MYVCGCGCGCLWVCGCPFIFVLCPWPAGIGQTWIQAMGLLTPAHQQPQLQWYAGHVPSVCWSCDLTTLPSSPLIFVSISHYLLLFFPIHSLPPSILVHLLCGPHFSLHCLFLVSYISMTSPPPPPPPPPQDGLELSMFFADPSLLARPLLCVAKPPASLAPIGLVPILPAYCPLPCGPFAIHSSAFGPR